MAGRYKKNYREYRGRRTGGASGVLKVIVVLLALLLAAAILCTLFLGDFVEYTDEGVRLNLSWRQEEASEPPIHSDSLVIITPEPTPEPEPTPTPPEELEVLRGVEVTAAQLADGTAADVVRQAGGNCLVVEMKNPYGKLNWDSDAPLAQNAANSIAADVAKAVKKLAEQDELYLVARINCFRDQNLATAGIGGPLKTIGGKVWYDRFGLRWVSPVSKEVQSYFAQLCMELTVLGFDEILLECAGFPHFGEVHVLGDHGLRPEDLGTAVDDFWDDILLALKGSDVKVSFLVTQAMAAGTDTASGIRPEFLAACAERVWVKPSKDEPVDYAALLEQAGMDRAEERLVLIGQTDGTGSWAAITGPLG